eukprot:TRINITY_DN1061_c0_g1_i1.p1 TRINITY_DN1061_c0_g1~~TRINITY_DN1061_c0_g1_i1.p1  ORF type:complete len:872 (+),score=73.90 TRINITY_DN1061_c0_g1_i1:108-2723(+)
MTATAKMRARSHSVANLFMSTEDDGDDAGQSVGIHKQLRSKPKPAAKPAAAPPPTNTSTFGSPTTPLITAPARMKDWSVSDVADWVRKSLESHEYSDVQTGRIVRNFEENLIRGETMSLLDAEDWKTLVPLVGARKDLQAELQKSEEERKPPQSPNLPIWDDGESAIPGSNRRDSRSSDHSTPTTIHSERSSTTTPTPPATAVAFERKGSAEGRTPLLLGQQPSKPAIPALNLSKPNNNNQARADSADTGEAKPGFDVNNDVPTYHAPDTKFQWRDLLSKSRFSHAPIIDNNPRVPGEHSWATRLFHSTILGFVKLIYLLRTLLLLLTWRDVLLAMLPVGSTLICDVYGLRVDFNPGLFLTSLIFPLSFAVNAAYQRRELALQHLGLLKSCTVSLYLCHRTWAYMPDIPKGYLAQTRKLIMNVFHCLRLYLTSWDEEAKEYYLGLLYNEFLQVSLQTDVLRMAGIPPPLVTRPIHDLREVMASFERLRVLADYRTPSSIRAFIKVAIIVVALLMSPAFANLATQEDSHGRVVAYGAPFAFFLLLKVMANVQSMLENPFITYGLSNQDDINLDYLRGVMMDGKPEETETTTKKNHDTAETAKFQIGGGGLRLASTIAAKVSKDAAAAVAAAPHVPQLQLPPEDVPIVSPPAGGASPPSSLKPLQKAKSVTKKSARIVTTSERSNSLDSDGTALTRANISSVDIVNTPTAGDGDETQNQQVNNNSVQETGNPNQPTKTTVVVASPVLPSDEPQTSPTSTMQTTVNVSASSESAASPTSGKSSPLKSSLKKTGLATLASPPASAAGRATVYVLDDPNSNGVSGHTQVVEEVEDYFSAGSVTGSVVKKGARFEDTQADDTSSTKDLSAAAPLDME